MGELTKLPNIGKELERQLHETGIDTIEQLKASGSRQAWLNILATDPSACYNRLCALEGAIREVRWHSLPDDVKKDLLAFYRDMKQ